MEALFLKLVNMSITAGWLVLAIIGVRLVFRRLPRWSLCLLWGLVAVRLICPLSIESTLSLIPSAEPLPQEIIYTAQPEIQSGVPAIDNAVNPMLASSLTPAQLTSANPTQIWSFILSQVWILGMVLMFGYTLISYLLLKRKVATAIPLAKGIKRSEYVDTPFVLGVFRPVIYLPVKLAEADVPHVIAHEKAHISRRDHWWKPLGFLLLSIYWFNPLLWVAYLLLCRDIEAACDERVIRNMEKDHRRAYSKALLHCSIHRRRIAACPLAFGEVGVKTRVKAVMNYRRPSFWLVTLCLLLILGASVCFLTDPRQEAPDCPVTMELAYFNRTMAHLIFQYAAPLPEGSCQISEAYSLEALREGKWVAVAGGSKPQAANEVVEVQTEDREFDAWSILRWDSLYGRLGDGTYRICKEITIVQASGEAERYPVSVEFTLGGRAEDFITYSLEDITSTGAKLYEHEWISEEIPLIYSEGFWLEALLDGQWRYLEPTEDVPPLLGQSRHFIHGVEYPSSHIQLDWSSLYGPLPGGTYRVAREITNTDPGNPRLCTVYGEFTLENQVTAWFEAGQPVRQKELELPGMEDVILIYSQEDNAIYAKKGDDTQCLITGWPIENVYLSDLSGDGLPEICATVLEGFGIIDSRVRVYDYARKQLYELQNRGTSDYFLDVRNDCIVVTEAEHAGGTVVDMGILALTNEPDPAQRSLRLISLDSSFQAVIQPALQEETVPS